MHVRRNVLCVRLGLIRESNEIVIGVGAGDGAVMDVCWGSISMKRDSELGREIKLEDRRG